MKKVIWKIKLKIAGYQQIQLPLFADILCIQMQGNTPCLWALVCPENTPENREIEMYETGQQNEIELEKTHRYIGTIRPNLVYHVFEKAEFID